MKITDTQPTRTHTHTLTLGAFGGQFGGASLVGRAEFGSCAPGGMHGEAWWDGQSSAAVRRVECMGKHGGAGRVWQLCAGWECMGKHGGQLGGASLVGRAEFGSRSLFPLFVFSLQLRSEIAPSSRSAPSLCERACVFAPSSARHCTAYIRSTEVLLAADNPASPVDI